QPRPACRTTGDASILPCVSPWESAAPGRTQSRFYRRRGGFDELLGRSTNLRIFPDQHRLARRQRLVEAAAGCEVWGSLQRWIAVLGACGDGTQRADELVKRGLALGFCRLDQHGAVDDEREIDRHRVEAFVDQPLGDVQCRKG